MLRFLSVCRKYIVDGRFIITRAYPGSKSDDIKIHQVKEFNIEKTPITAQLWDQRKFYMESPVSDLSAQETEPVLFEKTGAESRKTILYCFTRDASLRDAYINTKGYVLIGKLMEDLDALAGNIAFAHCDDQNPLTRPLSLVTASVDKIIKTKPLSINEDLILTGQVAWVGRSSLDVIMEVHSSKKVNAYSAEGVPELIGEKGDDSRLLTSLFTYVAKNHHTGKTVKINRYKPISESEIKLFNSREVIATSRKNKLKGLDVERETLTSLVERGIAAEDMPALAHPNAVLMRHTELQNSLICQPQNVNTAGKVFGGFIIHRAFDLAIATCYTFAGSFPQFRQVDKITFNKPVDIGDLVRLKSRVVCTSDSLHPLAHVEVTCQVVRPEKASSFLSNKFNFVFGFEDTVTLRRLLPTTYEEAATLVNASKNLKELS